MELDLEAWARWLAYRTAIKKPLKPMSEEAAKMKLARFGADQAAVVDQSIANGWQGWFALPKEKVDPHAPKVRTSAQKAADEAHWEFLNKQSCKEWDKVLQTPLTRLKLASTLLARYDTESDQGSLALAEKKSWLKDRCAELLREADAAQVLADLECWRLVLRLFNSPGINRLHQRAAELRAKEAA